MVTFEVCVCTFLHNCGGFPLVERKLYENYTTLEDEISIDPVCVRTKLILFSDFTFQVSNRVSAK